MVFLAQVVAAAAVVESPEIAVFDGDILALRAITLSEIVWRCFKQFPLVSDGFYLDRLVVWAAVFVVVELAFLDGHIFCRCKFDHVRIAIVCCNFFLGQILEHRAVKCHVLHVGEGTEVAGIPPGSRIQDTAQYLDIFPASVTARRSSVVLLGM